MTYVFRGISHGGGVDHGLVEVQTCFVEVDNVLPSTFRFTKVAIDEYHWEQRYVDWADQNLGKDHEEHFVMVTMRSLNPWLYYCGLDSDDYEIDKYTP